MAVLRSKEKSKYLKFPFSTCNYTHLKEPTSLVKHGINLTIQLGLLDFENFDHSGENIHLKKIKAKKRNGKETDLEEDDLGEDLEEDEDEEDDVLRFDHIPPSPILIPTDLPKSSFRKGSFDRRGSNDNNQEMSLILCRRKIENMIGEYFPPDMINDGKVYVEIKNYIINSIIQNEDDIEQFLSRVVNHRFKNELADVIKSIFVEKFEELKLEELVDFFYSFFNQKYSSHKLKRLENPFLYETYYRIWRLQANNYVYYEEEYFFDYFNNGGKSLTSIEHVFLQNGFLVNYARFVSYFANDASSYCDETDEESEELEELEEEELEEIKTPSSCNISSSLSLESNYFTHLSNNYYLESSSHYPESSSHYPESSSHYPESSSHYPESSSHYPESSSHYPESSSHYPESSSHYPESSSHYPESSSHYPESSSHYLESSSHYPESSSHYPESSSHYLESSSHYPESSSHYLESSSHYLADKSSTLVLDPLMHIPKSLRFNDKIDIIKINRYLPVDHILYKQIIDEIS
ncbi:hypothetical protein KGF56_001046 [Candida oxycetoniae]|uniref:Uncharacterized protein n=1 Tax=Candida oxycetoniae TaxID=497107 RepID=A0AAI9WZL8_9ASCO|nr:uncharacterized protein KGF56_001046 [Candida oxycetoniae]KAI3406204.2 hypothetical protein KGF56_001046 [Candida oxycetoniae]